MSYTLNALSEIKIPKKADNQIIEELLGNYTYGEKFNICRTENDCRILIGSCEEAALDGSEYVINANDGGVYIGGKDFPSVMRGFVTLLEKIKHCGNGSHFYIENMRIYGKPRISFRCAHLCVFPETDLDFLKKCIRSCAIVKYSHIILEFWGMLKFDCMKELAWSCAYSKAEIKALIAEANTLGVEIIPMFNHLGHASSCRSASGKHVVLDQNPRYEYMFDSYGWVWDITNPEVRSLHTEIRRELLELCGDVKYFHIGCDEAYKYGRYDEKARLACEYINSIAKELKEQGVRPIMWHDMMLARDDFHWKYYAHSTKTVSDIFINEIDKDILIADWEYEARYAPEEEEIWKTSEFFKENGFEVICCPWNSKQNVKNAMDTTEAHKLYGIIETTWHTLYEGVFRTMLYAGKLAYGLEEGEDEADIYEAYAAHITRKALPSCGKYEKSGWNERMTGPGMI